VERESVRAFGEFDANVVFGALAGIIFRELGAKSAGLDADHGIDGRVEIRRAAELFCSNLVFLQGGAGMLDRVVREIAQEFAQGFRAVEDGASCNLIYLA
jgi:hypothetical protein